MGEARKRDLSARDLALSKSRFCIFCGGANTATTADHYPPRSVFFKRSWPEDYVFPACTACNAGSRSADEWIGWLSRLDPALERNSEEMDRAWRTLRSLDTRHPGLIRDMFGGTAIEKKEMARRTGMVRGEGETYKDLPIVKIPAVIHDKVAVFSAKLTRALHFHHSGRIAPPSAAIRHKWFTNASQLEGKIPDKIFQYPMNEPDVSRGAVDLSEQFFYRYSVAADGSMGLFVSAFRFSFMVVSAISFDPDVMTRIEAAAADALAGPAPTQLGGSLYPTDAVRSSPL